MVVKHCVARGKRERVQEDATKREVHFHACKPLWLPSVAEAVIASHLKNSRSIDETPKSKPSYYIITRESVEQLTLLVELFH